ncbi:MFS transporter [Rhodococcus sp. IEGM 248]|uniref:MFS transporter n=1 Tax=Rhodococcus opacus TaxID=37919 RepID=UPI0013C1DC20|nr:MFS transporter [Rhodococcus opacus]MDV7083550.1 MFS transporter [Rhodococcus opacus]NDV03367.1 MFS transporter [Rhodococcus sp. IEGM 248]
MNRPTAVAPPIRARSPRPATTLSVASLGTFVALVAFCAPLGNMPTVAAALSAGAAAQTWILSSMSVGLAAVLLTAGALADDYGRRRVFHWGAWLLALGAVVGAVSQEPVLFIVGRLIQGVAGAALIAASLGAVAHAFTTPAARASASGIWGASVGAGIAVGPVLAGLLDLAGWWRGLYWALAVASLVIGQVAMRALAESRSAVPKRIDVPGAVTLCAAMVLVLVALVEGRQGNIAATVLCGVGAAVFTLAFVTVELRRPFPMLDLALFRRRDFLAATLAALATGAGIIGLMSFACTFLVKTMHVSTLAAAGVIGLWSGTSVVASLLARTLPARLAGSPQLVIGLAGVGVAMLTMTGLSPDSSLLRLVPGLLLAGVASGLLNAGLGRQAVASVPADQGGLGSGANNTARYLGSSIGVTVVSIIALDPAGTVDGMVSGWNYAAVTTGLISLVGAGVVGLLVRGTAVRR